MNKKENVYLIVLGISLLGLIACKNQVSENDSVDIRPNIENIDSLTQTMQKNTKQLKTLGLELDTLLLNLENFTTQ